MMMSDVVFVVDVCFKEEEITETKMNEDEKQNERDKRKERSVMRLSSCLVFFL